MPAAQLAHQTARQNGPKSDGRREAYGTRWPLFLAVFCFFIGMHVFAPDASARSAVRGCLYVQGSEGRSPRFGNPAHGTVAAESQKSASVSPHWLIYASHAVDLKRPPG